MTLDLVGDRAEDREAELIDRAAPTSEESIVFGVRADPEPDDRIAIENPTARSPMPTRAE